VVDVAAETRGGEVGATDTSPGGQGVHPTRSGPRMPPEAAATARTTTTRLPSDTGKRWRQGWRPWEGRALPQLPGGGPGRGDDCVSLAHSSVPPKRPWSHRPSSSSRNGPARHCSSSITGEPCTLPGSGRLIAKKALDIKFKRLLPLSGKRSKSHNSYKIKKNF